MAGGAPVCGLEPVREAVAGVVGGCGGAFVRLAAAGRAATLDAWLSVACGGVAWRVGRRLGALRSAVAASGGRGLCGFCGCGGGVSGAQRPVGRAPRALLGRPGRGLWLLWRGLGGSVAPSAGCRWAVDGLSMGCGGWAGRSAAQEPGGRGCVGCGGAGASAAARARVSARAGRGGSSAAGSAGRGLVGRVRAVSGRSRPRSCPRRQAARSAAAGRGVGRRSAAAAGTVTAPVAALAGRGVRRRSAPADGGLVCGGARGRVGQRRAVQQRRVWARRRSQTRRACRAGPAGPEGAARLPVAGRRRRWPRLDAKIPAEPLLRASAD